MLTARGADPRHATLPPGHDPASLLRTAGPAALHQQLLDAPPLADTLINERLANLPPASRPRPCPHHRRRRSRPPLESAHQRHRPPAAHPRRRRPHPTTATHHRLGPRPPNRQRPTHPPSPRNPRPDHRPSQPAPHPTLGTPGPPDRPSLDPRPRLGRPRRNHPPARPGRHRHADPASPNRRPSPTILRPARHRAAPPPRCLPRPTSRADAHVPSPRSGPNTALSTARTAHTRRAAHTGQLTSEPLKRTLADPDARSAPRPSRRSDALTAADECAAT